MKLNSALVERTLTRFEAQPIPDNHPAIPQLNDAFGEHTFFLNGAGLHVVEPVAENGGAPDEGKVIKLASWVDAEKSGLAPHGPQPTDVVIPLKADEADPAA